MSAEPQIIPSVRPTGDRYCYFVRSATNPSYYHVCDLTANNGAGICSCRDHQTRRQPALDRGEKPLTNATLCRHLKQAYWQFLREVMPALAAEDDKPKRTPNPHHNHD